MLRYLRSEIYRLLHKKSMYLYLAGLAILYALFAFVRSGGFTPDSLISHAVDLFTFLPPLVGGYFFAALYTDDLSSKNLTTLIGFGMSKTGLVLAKLILMLVSCAVLYGLMPLFHCALYAVLGWPGSAANMATVYLFALRALLLTLAFAALSGIVVYGLQRGTFAFVLYILLAFNLISSMLTVFVKMFVPLLADYLILGITDRMVTGLLLGGPLLLPCIAYVLYVAVAAALSALAFHKKEMEF
ncbi:MAG: hypothetical protein FWF91_02905 [Coriobacteriia bacterium]|nr:hypothetical protein [Coriobacteriia bacterium]